MYEKCPKVIILVNFDQFSDPLAYSMALYYIKEVHVRAQNLPIAFINLYYQKMYSYPTLVV